MSKLRAFVPKRVFSQKELLDLALTEEQASRAYLVSLLDHENMLSPSVRESMKVIAKTEKLGDH